MSASPMHSAKPTSIGQVALRWLVLGHRWLGIVTCILFVVWFASGLVMMYVGYPSLTTAERMSRSQTIEWNRVRIEPERVLHGLSLAEFPRTLRLVMMNGEPVYQVVANGWPTRAVSAVDGRIIENITAAQALSIARLSAPDAQPAVATTIELDQWSVAGTYDPHRPLHLVPLSDALGTEVYVSSVTGEIVLDSTRRERAWNWIGAVLHWFYFRDLRVNGPLWSQVVMWTSGIGIFGAITGLWLGIDRLRLRRRNQNAPVTPFRGWMAWHHIAGVIGGVFVLTWIFSGWLSMGPPVPWEKPFDPRPMAAGIAAFAGNTDADFPMDAATFHRLADRNVREASFVWILGRPTIVVMNERTETELIDAATGNTMQLRKADLEAAAPKLLADAKLIESQALEHEDAYWYSRRGERSVPVLRFKFDDADQTWVHVDPRTGKIVGWMRDSDRIHRWLFNALHSFDFRWLLDARPAWDLLLWALSIAGLTISVSGVVIGWRHLKRRT